MPENRLTLNAAIDQTSILDDTWTQLYGANGDRSWLKLDPRESGVDFYFAFQEATPTASVTTAAILLDAAAKQFFESAAYDVPSTRVWVYQNSGSAALIKHAQEDR